MLHVQHIHQYYENGKQPFHAVQDVSFSVPEGKLFTLLGPSGSGKTSVLRCIAGLEKPSAGVITMGDTILFSAEHKVFVSPDKRDMGMMFQSYAIWPHMNVFENVAFPLKIRKKKYSKKSVEEKVLKILDTVQLSGFESLNATNLSGGQQQRLALARALVMEPTLLLLDEPLSNLDAKLREEMRFQLKRLQRDLGITTIYVTHDQSEALAMSNVMAVMEKGQIAQMGHPRHMYENPCNQFVADFLGASNFIQGRIVSIQGHYCIATEHGELQLRAKDAFSVGEHVMICARPENINVFSTRPEGPNVLTGTLITKIFEGERLTMQIRCGSQLLKVSTHPANSLKSGQPLFIQFSEDTCIIFRDENIHATV